MSATTADTVEVESPPARDWGLRVLVAVSALNSVAPLMAWVYGVGQFSTWFWRWTVPWLTLCAGLGVWISRSPSHRRLSADLRAGVIGGLIGTALYDLVRIPFLLMGLRLLAPIDSYGVLALDAAGSSGRTGLAGWLFHTSNGIFFAVAYAAVAARRHPAWAVAWAMVLESAAVLSPFALRYGLNHRWGLIAVAYAAHIPYGLAIGLACRNPERTLAKAREVTRAPVVVSLGLVLASMLLWQRPWSTPGDVAAGEAVAPGPSAVIRGRHFSPQWIRVPAEGCASIRNDDAVAYRIGTTDLAPGAVTSVCFTGDGVHRIKLAGLAWTGGFVIVDPQEEQP